MKPFTPNSALDDQLLIGLADTAVQHHRLSDIIDRLSSLHISDASHEQLFAILSELKNYVAIVGKYGEAHFDSHILEQNHKETDIFLFPDFKARIQRACDIAATYPETAVSPFISYFAQWRALLSSHSERPADLIASANWHMSNHTLDLIENNAKLHAEIAENKVIGHELLNSELHFRTLAENTHHWEYWEGPQGEIIYMSPSCERITGYPPEEFVNNPELLYSIIHPEDWYVMNDHQKDFNLTEDGHDNELGFRIMRPDGDIRWILHSCRAMYNSQGQFIGRKGSNRDTTNPGSRSDLMLLVASVFDAVNEAVVLTDEYGRIILVNAMFTNITGYQLEEVIGQSPNLLSARKKSPLALLESWECKTVKGRWEQETTHRRKNGETYAASATIDCVRDETGHATNYLLVFSDINDQKANERKLHYLAHYDQLTGFPNWVLFNDRLRQAIAASKRRKQMIALMLIDVDHFRATRDQIGHEKGDLLIKEIASRITRCIRDSDTAARVGNDEFAILLKRVSDVKAISAITSQILQATSEPVLLNDESLQISVSIGIAVFPEHGTNSEQLMRNADLATYEAKQSGGYAAQLYKSMNEDAQQLNLW